MVAVVSGNGLGVFNTSLTALGGVQGSDLLIGQNKTSQLVNLATGNLILQNQDESLSVRGFSTSLIRTYNSQGVVAGAGQDGWQTGYERRVALTSGAFNDTNSVVTLYTGDGQTQIFKYVSNNNYESTDGDGANDKLVYSGTTWTYTEGSTRREERYENLGSYQGRLQFIRESKTAVEYEVKYSGNNIIEVLSIDGTGAAADAILFGYDANNRLTSISTREGGIIKSQVSYGYDGVGRLSWVQQDLTPTIGADNTWDSATAANNNALRHRTTYTYVTAAASDLRIASVSQSDGVTVSFTYDGSNRISTVTVGSETTTFTYGASQTDVADAHGRTWSYVYDTNKQLTQVLAPAVNGQRDTTTYTYDTKGNVTQIKVVSGSTTLSQIDNSYDAKGNLTGQWKRLGSANATATYQSMSYDSTTNQLLTEKTYTGLDTDGTGAATATGALTKTYIYDTQNRLKFAVDATGQVIEWVYNTTGSGIGQVASSRVYTGAAFTGTINTTNLNNWKAAQPATSKASGLLTTYSYDVKGRLQQEIAYATLDSSGNAVFDSATAVTSYSYDAQGFLLQQMVVRGSTRTATYTATPPSGSEVTSYAYDGMGRLLSVIKRDISSVVGNDSATVASSYAYIDSANQVVVTQDAGATVTTTSNSAGRAVTVVEAGAGMASRTLQNYYDAAGQLRASQDAAGGRTYFFYDAKGRLEGQVDPSGAVVQNLYDGANRLVSTVQYANKVSTSSWLSGSTVTVALFANISVVADGSKDRVQLMTYDFAGRLVSQSDGALSNADRSITNYTYDGANRLVQVDITDALGTVATKRTSRTLYDAAGRVLATVDAELYVVENKYDGSGLLTSSIRYAAKTANGTATTVSSLRPALNANDDQTTRYYYNGRGQLTGTLDAQGYLTEFVIDEQGNARSERRYANAITWISTDTLATLKSKGGTYLESRMAYNGLGQLLTKTNTEGTVSRFSYDEAGRLVRTETAADTTEVRDGFIRYNVFNEVIGEIGGVQAETARLTLLAGKYLNDATLSESQLNSVYSQFGVTHSYNALGLREESVDAQGNKTWYFYDANGRQTFLAKGTAQNNMGATGALNSFAEITETRFDAFGSIIDSITYTGKVQIPVPGSRASLAGVLSTLIYSAATDSKRSYAYTARGQLASQIDAEGALTTYSYNAFGERIQQVNASGMPYQLTQVFGYDKRGLGLTESQSGSGVTTRTLSQSYDAFGRVITATDARGVLKSNTYDRVGRLITQSVTVAGQAEITTYSYDSYNRLLSVKDALNKTTQYSYNDVTRSISVTTPEAITVTSVRSRHGQNVSVSNGLNQTTTTSYDKNGNILSITDALGNVSSNSYDVRGLLAQTTDAEGRVVTLAYDAVGRVLSRVVDPAGLNLVSQTKYDGQGRTVETVDPAGRKIQYSFDREGRLSQSALDPSGLNLRTKYTYDALGRQVKVEEGYNGISAIKTTAYEYDAFGRRVAERLDPNGINSLTAYLYDANDNVIKRTDAGGNVTRFVYDEANRLRYTIDPLGSVTETGYDKVGRVLSSRSYFSSISLNASEITVLETLTGSAAVNTIAGKLVVNNAFDLRVSNTYDNDGRLTRQTDALGNFESYAYDAAGNKTSKTDKLGNVWSYGYDALGRLVTESSPSVSVASVNDAGVVSTANRSVVTKIEYDKTGNTLKRIEDFGFQARTTEYLYDAAGRQIKTIFPDAGTVNASGQLVTTGIKPEIQITFDAAGQAVVQKDVRGNYSYKVYDAAGRLAYDIDAEGYVSKYSYNDVSQQTTMLRYATKINTAGISGWNSGQQITLQQIQTVGVLVAGSSDRTITTGYDARGLKASVTLSAVVAYDMSGGNSTAASPTTLFTYNTLGQLVKESLLVQQLPSAVWANTYHYYDASGRERFSVDAEGYVSETKYNVLGQITEVVQYARPVSTVALTETAPPSIPVAGDSASGFDRITRYSYDALGRKTAELTVSHYQAADGSPAERNVTTSMVYDANGQLVRLTADGIDTQTQYDAIGRVASVQEAERDVLRSNAETTLADSAIIDLASVAIYERSSPYTTLSYDAFGNQVQVTRYANGLRNGQILADVGRDSVTVNRYDLQGRSVMTLDAVGNKSYFKYDAADNVLETWYRLDGNDGRYSMVKTVAAYDKVGRQLSTQTTRDNFRTLNGQDTAQELVNDAREFVTYNAFGEVVSKGFDGSTQPVLFTYDNAGRLTGSNADGAVNKSYGYSLSGAQVRESHQTLSTTGTVVTATTLQHIDRLGRAVRYVTPSYTSVSTDTATINQQLDRWGNVLVLTDARGYQTTMEYNAANQVTRTVKPLVLVVNADGTSAMQRPEARTFYDALGRLIAEMDANGNIERYEYNAVGQRIAEIDALGNRTLLAYDVLGNQRLVQNPLGYMTYQAFDRLGRVTEHGDYLPMLNGMQRSKIAIERYDLNQLGARLTVTDAANAVSRYDYDSRNLLIRSETAMGIKLEYVYDSQGRKIREINALSNQSLAPNGWTNQSVMVGTAGWSFSIPSNEWTTKAASSYFAEIATEYVEPELFFDDGDKQARIQAEGYWIYRPIDGSDWLQFNAGNQTFTGTAPNNPAYMQLRVTKNNSDGTKETKLVNVNVTAGSDQILDQENEQVRLHEQTWDYDAFGRLIDHNDLSGIDYNYVYNATTSQQESQSSAWTQPTVNATASSLAGSNQQYLNGVVPGTYITSANRVFKYYANGMVKEISEGSNTYRYEYDAAGNRTLEESEITDANGDMVKLRTRMTYDSHNRLEHITQDDYTITSKRILDLVYSYDANGNRRRVQAQGALSSTAPAINTANNAPVTTGAKPVADKSMKAGVPVTFKILLSDVFRDYEMDPLAIMVKQTNGNALPSWLTTSLDATTGELIFTASNGSVIGTTNIRISATETNQGASNDTVYTDFSLNVVSNSAPVLISALADTRNIKQNQSMSMELAAASYFSEPDLGDTLSLSIVSVSPSAPWLQIDTSNPQAIRISGTPTTAGTYTVTLRATDASGAWVNKTINLIASANTAPSGIAQTSLTNIIGRVFEWTQPLGAVFSDIDANITQISVTLADGSALPIWMSLETVYLADGPHLILAGQAPTSVANNTIYTVKFTATDALGLTGTTQMNVLFKTNSGPTILGSIPDQNIYNGTNYLATFNLDNLFTDSDGDLLDYNVTLPQGSQLSSWLSVSVDRDAGTISFSGVPSGVSSGSHTLTLQAIDPSGQSVTMNVNLNLTSGAPTVNQNLLNGMDPFAGGGDPVSINITSAFSDPNGDALTYSQTGKPAWLTFNATTGIFSGIAPDNDRTFSITVTASDGNGGNVSGILTITTYATGGGGGGGGGGGQQPFMMMPESMLYGVPSYPELEDHEPIGIGGGGFGTGTSTLNQDVWYAYDALNRVVVANGALVGGQILLSNNAISAAYNYDAAGNQVARRLVLNGSELIERRTYDLRGQQIYMFQPVAPGATPTTVMAQTSRYDVVGRLVEQIDYYGAGSTRTKTGGGTQDISGWIKHAETMSYDKDGRLLSQTSKGRVKNWVAASSATGQGDLSQLSTLTVTTQRYDGLSRSSGYTWNYKEHDETYAGNASDAKNYTHTYAITYEGRDGYLEKSNYGYSSNSNFKASTATSQYDAWGRLIAVREHTPKQSDTDDRVRYMSLDGDGMILRRREGTYKNSAFSQTTAEKGRDAVFTYGSGQQLAEQTRDGTKLDVFGLMGMRDAGPASKDQQKFINKQARKGNVMGAYDQIAQRYSVYGQDGASRVQVQSGDSLQGIAQRVYGNSSLWYVLAAANALSGDSELIAGTQLRVPEVGVSKNDASTFKPYNPNEIVGSTSPSLPYIPPASSNGCGYVIQFVMIVAAAVVSFYMPVIAPQVASILGTSLGVAEAVVFGATAFTAHAASTAVGSAMGLTTFSWRQSLGQGIVAGLTAGIGAKLGTTSELLKNFATKPSWMGAAKIAASAASGALADYAGNELAGVKGNSFSWKSIAASAVANVVTAAIGNKLNLAPKYENGIITTGDFAKDFAYGAIGGVVSLHTRRAFGFNDKVDYGDIAANAFATAVGNAAGRSIAKSIEMRKDQKNPPLLTDDQYNDMMDRRFWLASNDSPITMLDKLSNSVLEAGGLYSTASEEENPYLGKEGLQGVSSDGVVCEAPDNLYLTEPNRHAGVESASLSLKHALENNKYNYVTASILVQTFGTDSKIASNLELNLNEAMYKFEINTIERQAAYLAQLVVETGNFTSTKNESFYYQRKGITNFRAYNNHPEKFDHFNFDFKNKKGDFVLRPSEHEEFANLVYGSYGPKTGNTNPGDGYLFRGRGFIQLTGRYNYEKVGQSIGYDLIGNPDLVNDPVIGQFASAAYFKLNGLNELADRKQFEKITYVVNSKAMHIEQRQKYYNNFITLYNKPQGK